MVDFVITSEHRVGSRWQHRLFADFLDKDLSPELDAKRLYEKDTRQLIINHFKNNKIVKFHHATANQIIEALELASKENDYDLDLKILGIVREPRDQGVSLCFHNRYHNRGKFKEQEFDTDEEALEYTILESPWYIRENLRQFQLMVTGHSILSHASDLFNKEQFKQFPYIWFTYEMVSQDTFGNVLPVLQFLGEEIKEAKINNIINEHTFSKKAGRDKGEEKRDDLWRRKGVVGDWKEKFNHEMIERTEFLVVQYNRLIQDEAYLNIWNNLDKQVEEKIKPNIVVPKNLKGV
jgi:hypothetical protein